jgi:hypothetical protein
LWQEGSLWEPKVSGQDIPDSMKKAGLAPDKDSLFSNSGEISPGQEPAEWSVWFGSPNG